MEFLPLLSLTRRRAQKPIQAIDFTRAVPFLCKYLPADVVSDATPHLLKAVDIDQSFPLTQLYCNS